MSSDREKQTEIRRHTDGQAEKNRERETGRDRDRGTVCTDREKQETGRQTG